MGKDYLILCWIKFLYVEENQLFKLKFDFRTSLLEFYPISKVKPWILMIYLVFGEDFPNANP